MKTETRYGYRTTEVYTDESEETKTIVSVHDIGPGHSNKAFCFRKVEWLNGLYPGKAEVVQRVVTYSEWESVRDD